MCLQYNHQEACKMASQLGASIEEGVDDWTWAKGFPSAEVAWHFQTQFNGMNSVGAYPERDGHGFTVYFR